MLLDPLLISGKYRKITLKNYETLAHIGAYRHEKGLKQRLRFNVAVYVEKSELADDDLGTVFNYDRIAEAIETVLKKGHMELQETVVDQVADLILQAPEVKAVHVKTEKPDAYAKSESIGLEAFFSK